MRNPWLDLPASAPYVLPCDRETVERFNKRASPDVLLRLQHLPEPFLGRRDAPVVLLNLNPGFSDEDDRWHGDPRCAAKIRANHAHERMAWPFYLLDPEFDSPGQGWWRKRFAGLIERTSLEQVARNILCVELHAYHSVKFGLGAVQVPSQEYGIELVREAMKRGAYIVRMRSERPWFERLPQLATYPRLVRVSNVQNPHLSNAQLGANFETLVRAIQSS